jgi:hypothetical protein
MERWQQLFMTRGTHHLDRCLECRNQIFVGVGARYNADAQALRQRQCLFTKVVNRPVLVGLHQSVQQDPGVLHRSSCNSGMR